MLVDILIFVFGLGLTATGIYLRYSSKKFKKACTSVIYGTLTGHEERRGGRRGSIFYYPIVSYSVGGVEYEYTFSLNGYAEPVIPDGEKVTLLYNKDNPKQCYAANERISFNIVLHIFLVIVGSFIMLVGGTEIPGLMKIIFVLISLFLILHGINKWLKGSKLRRECTMQTHGMKEKPSGDQKYTVPLFTYTVDGDKYALNKIIKFKAEESIDIFYNPDNPMEYYEAKKRPSVISGFFSIIMGVFLLLLFHLF